MKKGCEQEEAIPIAPNDLKAIGDILAGYIASLQRHGQGSTQTRKKLQQLQDIHARIQFLCRSDDGVAVVVTVNDLLTIREAMVVFVQFVRRMVPQSSERDETLRCVTQLRWRLEKNILP